LYTVDLAAAQDRSIAKKWNECADSYVVVMYTLWREYKRTSKRVTKRVTMPTKSKRINVRVTDDQRELLASAAATAGETLSSFVLHNALSEARRVVEVHHVTVIEQSVLTEFADWLEAPPRLIPEMKPLVDAEPFEQR
jgi:uncharacterized protein (DUF1778 family)